MNASAALVATADGTADEAEPYARLTDAHAAGQFGMWVFLATEIMFFGALFTGYALMRVWHGPAFEQASRLTDVVLGTTNTVVLLTSSFTIALAGRSATLGDTTLARRLLLATLALGVVFLAIKGIEYAHDFDEHLWPGSGFRFVGPDAIGVRLFYWLYFAMTGFHAVHMTIGIAAVGVVAWRLGREPQDDGAHHLELTALYWHLVDIVWIFLYPLLYLVARTPT